MYGILSIGYNRPALHKLGLSYLSKCYELEDWHVHILLDKGSNVTILNELVSLVSRGKTVESTVRPARFGLDRNILLGIQETFQKFKDIQYLLVLEEDVLVSRDILRFMRVCAEGFDWDALDVCSATGYRGGTPGSANQVHLDNWYVPDATMFRRTDWDAIYKLIPSHYYTNPKSSFIGLEQKVRVYEPQWADRYWRNGEYIGPTSQDGLIGVIMAILNKRMLVANRSRCQDVGFYGQHEQKGDPNDLLNRELWKKSGWYVDSFEEDHIWDKLELPDGQISTDTMLRG